MTVIVKIDEGTARKLIKQRNISSEEPKDLLGKELTLELNDSDVTIERFKEKKKDVIEISDVNGSFGIWFTPTVEKVGKLKQLLEKGP